EIKRLSQEQRYIIQKTFKYLYNDPQKNGQKIFVLLLGDFPEYKQIWPQFSGIPDSSIITADVVKEHGLVYLAGLKAIIDSMPYEEKLVKTINRITTAHLKWNICKSHIMVWKHVEEAWFTLFDVIGNLVDTFK
ncbi:Uncharacterized protein BM_BM3476, partial [Brugia malayi]